MIKTIKTIKTYIMKNTYIQENKFKNYEFSKGEEMTEEDLACVASRTKRTYQTDAAYEAYMSEEFSSRIFTTFKDTAELEDEEN